MLEKTRGIVLRLTDFSDTSVVVQIFTERFGIQSYLVQGAKRARARLPANMMQPLQLLDLVVRHRPSANLQRLAEMRPSPPFLSIPYEVDKSSVVLFINEVLYKTLRNQGPDKELFEFVFNAIAWLDSVERMPADFHLFFLFRLTRFLGFHPAQRRGDESYFDLKDGVYLRCEPSHPFVLSEPYVSFLTSLSTANVENLHTLGLTREQRKFMLTKMLEFYQLHMDYIGEIKSREVLEELFVSGRP